MNLTRLIGMLAVTVLLIACNQEAEKPVLKETDSTATQTQDTFPSPDDYPFFVNTDRSPMDMVYFPDEYPKLKMANGTVVARPVMRVIYSRPHLSKRRFVDILKYDTPWRLGANEATEIEFFRDVIIDGQKLKQGRYILYCIPRENEWTIALNSNTDTWGLQQDSNKDVQRVVVPVTHNNPKLEFFTITFEKQEKGANLVLAWDDVVAKLGIGW